MYVKSFFLFLLILVAPAQANSAPLEDLLPKTVGDLHRIQLISGAAAQIEVDRLHGKALPAKASVVARYARAAAVGSERPAEVWISQVESEGEARRQIGLMVHKMLDNPRSPFKNPGRSDHGGIGVYHFDGMGQTHLIWYKGDIVYWISVAPADKGQMLDVFCR